MKLKFGSVCSGIEAASVAWEPLGMRPAWFAEVDKAASALLAHRFPDVENLGDMTKIPGLIREGKVASPDVLVGGTPCQGFSIAGARGGLADPRGQLTLSYVEIVDAIDDQRAAAGSEPCIAVWENVPGCLTMPDNAFGCFLAALAGDEEPLEPGERPDQGKSSQYWSWNAKEQHHRPKWPVAGVVAGPQRTIGWIVRDAQYFGLAQRRRRVFVVASAREGFDPAAVLFEFDCVRRDSPPSREPGQAVAGTLDARATGGGFPGTDDTYTLGSFGAYRSSSSSPLRAAGGDYGGGSESLVARSIENTGDPSHDDGDGSPVSQTLDAVLHKGQTMPEKNRFPAVLQPVTGFSSKDYGADASEDGTGRGQPITVCHGTQDPCVSHETAFTMGRNNGGENDILAGQPAMAVRRLMPVECEALQGFPRNWTRIPARRYKRRRITKTRPEHMWERDQDGKHWWLMTADGPRYKQLGNSMAVPVMRWIGMRILWWLSEGRARAEIGL